MTLIEPPGVELAGADMMRQTGLASGSLYPILYVLEDAGLLQSRWEEGEPQALARPRRRLYKLTPLGECRAREAAAEVWQWVQPLTTRGQP